MTAGRLHEYQAYRHIDLPWLERLPRHWELRRAKTMFRSIDVRSRNGDEELLTVSSKRGIVRRRSANVTMFEAESYAGHKLCWPDDLVINSLWAWGRGLGVSRLHGIVSTAYGVYRLLPDFEDYAGFIHEFVRSSPFQWELQVRSRGIWISRLQLTDDAFLRAPIPLPPIEDAMAIVRYLQYVDRRVRRYISSKERQVRLLEERKQALIQRATTHGLDADVDMKASGVEWPGHVPAHWSVPRIKSVCGVGTGHTPSRKVPEYWQDCSIPWFTLADVHQVRGDRAKRVFTTDECVSELGIANSAARLLPTGTVILSRTASVGLSAILGRPMATSQDFMAWIPGPEVDSEFLLYVLRAMRPEFRRLMHGSTHNTIYMPTLHAFRMPLPPLVEQRAIVDALDQATAVLDRAVEAAAQEIAVMEDYRSRLVADVVTGASDVREIAASLPDETDELVAPIGDEESETEYAIEVSNDAALEEVEA